MAYFNIIVFINYYYLLPFLYALIFKLIIKIVKYIKTTQVL